MHKKILVCLYSCKSDKKSLSTLKDTNWYQKYSKLNNYQFIDVYADISTDKSILINDSELILKTEESYDNLSIKTYKMIEKCLELFNFDYLVKVDASIVEDRHTSISSDFSFDNFKDSFDDLFFLKSEYSGYYKNQGLSIPIFRAWASQKKLFVLPEALFSELGLDKFPTSYWSGKSYSLSRSYCNKIMDHYDIFEKFKNLMGGTEDLCVACALKH